MRSLTQRNIVNQYIRDNLCNRGRPIASRIVENVRIGVFTKSQRKPKIPRNRRHLQPRQVRDDRQRMGSINRDMQIEIPLNLPGTRSRRQRTDTRHCQFHVINLQIRQSPTYGNVPDLEGLERCRYIIHRNLDVCLVGGLRQVDFPFHEGGSGSDVDRGDGDSDVGSCGEGCWVGGEVAGCVEVCAAGACCEGAYAC